MSRGLGRVERRIVELLEGADSLPAGKIAWCIAGQVKPTPALAASVRRAVNALGKKGRLVRAAGRAWALEEKWRLWEERRERDEAILRGIEERERRAQAEAQKRADAERREQEDTQRRARPGSMPNRGADAPSVAARLIKVLGLLASSHDGEALSAARQAEQIRRQIGRAWEELIVVPVPFGEATAPSATSGRAYDGGNQDEIDRTIDAFQEAMNASSYSPWR